MRGTKKLVLEVRPESEYFEKALLFVNPDRLNDPHRSISDSADKLLSGIQLPGNYRESKERSPLFFIFAGAAAGSLLSWAAVIIIGLL